MIFEQFFIQSSLFKTICNMERKLRKTKHWWRVSLLLLVCLLGGSNPAWAGERFDAGGTWIQHQPTVNEPWIVLRVMFYDPNGHDGFFMHTQTEPGHDGPAVYIDDEYVCSPDWQLAWPGSGSGSSDKVEKQRGVEEWWYNEKDNATKSYTKTNTTTGQKYLVKFWNPAKSNEGQYTCYMHVYLKKWHVGETHKVKIKGTWRINDTKTDLEEVTLTTNKFATPYTGSPSAVMGDYGHMLVSGTLNSSHGPTTVGTTNDATWGSLQPVAPEALNTDRLQYGKGTQNFSNLSLAFSRTDFFDSQSKPVEYVIVEPISNPNLPQEDQFDVLIHQWFNVKVPGFVKANNLNYTTDLWNKAITLTWTVDESGNGSKNGTWSIYRGTTLVSSGLDCETTSYTDSNVPAYDTQYTYKVVFVPSQSPSGTVRSELTTEKAAKLERPATFFSNLSATKNYDNKIIFSWAHPSIANASGSTPVNLTVERSTDLQNWTTLKTIAIDNSETNSGSYEDTNANGLQSFVTYYYRLRINVMGKTYESGYVTGQLKGMSTVTEFTATRGTYSSMVKLKWLVNQVGTTTTYFTLYRRPLGSADERDWAEIHSTSGTAASYSYDDVTALPGSFNEYKVAVWMMNGSTRMPGSETTADGFSVSTGVISGRITYGTGTAVSNAKVTLKQQTGDSTTVRGMHSVKLSGTGQGFKYECDTTTLQRLFGSDFSIQMYINPDNTIMNGNKRYQLLDVYTSFTLFLRYDATNVVYHPGIYLQGKDYVTSLNVHPNEWVNIACVHKQGTGTTFYLMKGDSVQSEVITYNGTAVTVDPVIAKSANCISFANNASYNGTEFYNGYLDEFRFFTRALSEQDILHNYNHPLAGNESGLAIYYPFDEGIPSQTMAYDFSKTNGVANGRHATAKVAAASTDYLPSEDQLSLMTYTDTDGNYTVRGVPFSGEGTSYSIIPQLGIHEFSPSAQSRFVSASSLNHSGVDFEDVSSFPVSGKIFYANTNHPVEGVTFYVDGTICSKDGEVIQTASDGSYTISVPIGEHFIRIEKNGHVFPDGGRYPADPNNTGERIPFDSEIKNLDFQDETLVNFTGRIVGGSIQGDKPVGFGLSTNNIGVAELILVPTSDQYIMNLKKPSGESSYDFKPSNDSLPVISATDRINSKAWRGTGDADCNKFFILTDPATGEFSAMLPPLEYSIKSMQVKASTLSVGQTPITIDMSNPLIELSDTLHGTDGDQLYSYNTILRQTYHADATFTVSQKGREDGSFGISSYDYSDELGKLTVSDIYSIGADGKPVYKYGGPLFVKEDDYTFLIEGYEDYTNADNGEHDHVPLDGNIVTINNELSADRGVYVEGGSVDGQTVEAGQVADLKENQLRLDSLGQATYTWKAGLPNIAGDFTRTISITYDIEGRPTQWSGSGMAGIILGDLPTGNNFVTAGPDKLLMILRDPPGTNSFAEWTSGSSTTTSTVRGNTFTENFGVKFQHRFGLTTNAIVGTPGVGTVNVVEAKDDLTLGTKMESSGENSVTKTTTTTVTRTIGTSAAPEYVGAQGDVFVGTSTNLIFGKARNVGFQRISSTSEVKLGLEDIVSTGVDFNTMFSYTQNYIENVLMPNFELIRKGLLTTVQSQAEIDSYVNNSKNTVYLTLLSADDADYGANGTYTVFPPKLNKPASTYADPLKAWEFLLENGALVADSVKWVNSQIENWTKYLSQNEEAKVKVFKDRKKYLVGDNISFDSGTTISSSTETESSTTNTWDWNVSAGLVVENSFGFEINKFGLDCTIEDETTGGRHETDEDSESTVTSFSYTLAEDGDDDALSVDVLQYDAYGPIFHTRGGQTCCPYEGKTVTKYFQPGTTIMEATMQIEVPQITVDVPILTDVPTGGTADYTLRLSNASEIDEDVYYRLLVDDESNPNGANIMIDGKPVTDSRVIKIPAGQTVTKAMQLKQTNTSILDYEDIAVVLASQCQYDPTSTWDVITDTVRISAHFVPSSSAVDLALSNTQMNTQTGTNLVLTFSGFDRNYRGLKAFRLQYKPQGSTDWTQLHEYVTDSTAVTPNNELLPKTGSAVSYTKSMASFADGNYLFRCVSASTYGNEEVYRYSDEIAFVKDMQRPTPLGLPEPADGILQAGDEISVTFNEPIVKGELTKERNFSVTGVLNGAEVAHETALSMQNTETTAATEASITLAGKDFSADMWVNIQGPGTILSHGAGTSNIMIGTDASGKLTVSIGNNTYTSTKVMPKNKWAFLTLSYKNTEEGGELNATAASGSETTSLFSGLPVVKYEGNGPLAVGRNLSGAIHELLLWDEAHDMSTALMNRSRTKNPSTRHLIGYWKMDEGEGTTIRDYARNRHMTMPAETWYLNNENKAVGLDGSHYMVINTSQLQTFEGDDYALEFWMRGEKQNAEAQLAQVGEIALWINAQGVLQLTGKGAYLPADQSSTLATSSGDILDNAWHHIALNILRQGAAAVFVDGKRVLTTNAANVGSIASDKLLVGVKRTTFSAETGTYDYDRVFKGEVDEVRIWGASMSADLLSKQRRMRLTGSEDGLVAYYPFEIKTLDKNNQVHTIGHPDDLTGSGLQAQLSTLNAQLSTLSYTDEAPALRTKPTETNVSFSYVASDSKVVINIDEDPATIEGCTLNFSVHAVRDENGNYSEPAVWSAFINCNTLLWKDDALAADLQAGTAATVTTSVVNKGGTMQMWTLSGMPAWMQASTESGTTNPLAETKVTFTVTESTPIGKYEETIYLTSTDGIDVPLTISVTVRGEEPKWAVNASDFESSMNLIGTLDILGIPSEDSDDIVAAFVDGECRGIAHPKYDADYDSHIVIMTIYGNDDESSKEVTFKAYDASTGETYAIVETAQNISYIPHSLAGAFENPILLSAIDMQEQMLKLGKGWSWISLYVEPDDMSVPIIFGPVKDVVGMVKSQRNFMAYSDNAWTGRNFSLNNQSMYQVKMSESRTINLTGKKVNPQEKPITLAAGWNWVAYNGSQTMSITDALADMEPQNGDYVKSQNSFATYNNGKWKGLLEALVPGQGYMIQSATNRTFHYPKSTATANARMAKAYEEQPTFFTPVDYSNYADNMTVIARVQLYGLPTAGMEVGVFAGDECRAAGISDDEGMVFLTIPGDVATELTFRIADGSSYIDCDETLNYSSNAIIGTIDKPFILNAIVTGISNLNTNTAGSEIYDLQGRRVYRQAEGVQRSTLKKGVYIENGQKRVKK